MTEVVAGVVREYCTKYQGMSTRSLAMLLLNSPETSAYFTGYEQARSAVRYHRGLHSNGRKRAQHPVPLVIPEPQKPEFKVVHLPRGLVWLILSDIHIPYHDRRAVELSIAEGKRRGCNAVIYNGDILDCYQVSRHNKDPRKPGIDYEREQAVALFEYVQEQIKPKKTLWKLGNHEDRLYSWLCVKAPELLAMPEFRWENLCHLDEFGIELVESPWIMRYEELTILHGHELGKGMSAPVNPARGAFLRAKDYIVQGHYHRTSNHVEPTVRGQVISTWSTGCLCDVHPRYAPINSWDQGAAVLDAGTRDWQFSNFRIINGKVFA